MLHNCVIKMFLLYKAQCHYFNFEFYNVPKSKNNTISRSAHINDVLLFDFDILIFSAFYWFWHTEFEIRIIPFAWYGDEAYGGCDGSAEDIYSSMAPDSTFAFVGGPYCPSLNFVIPYWTVITFHTLLSTLFCMSAMSTPKGERGSDKYKIQWLLSCNISYIWARVRKCYRGRGLPSPLFDPSPNITYIVRQLPCILFIL
jgi:hypothetical protein